MRVLGGFLKAIGILIILAATILCTAVAVMEGVVEGYKEAIWVMAAVWVGAMAVALSVLGTGMALTRIWKLTKRVEQLETKSSYAPAAPAPVDPISAEPVAAPTQPVAQAPAAVNRWMPVLVSVGVAVVAVAVVFMLINRKDEPVQMATQPSDQAYETEAATIAPPQEEDMFAPVEEQVSAEREMTYVSTGETISTDFVEMTFMECVISEDIQKKVTIDNVTRITGPDPIPGNPYILISGTIKNTSKAPLPVYDFFTGNINICGYGFDVRATDCDILSADGSTESEIDPLMEYEIRIYTAIPPELAEMATASGEVGVFTFGFYDGFANEELAYNSAFSDDPIGACPYRYEVALK